MVEDCFLKIDGIPGESQDHKHKDWIQLASFSWGLTEQRTGMRAGSGAGRAKFSDLQVMKVVDKASPLLFLACASAKHIKEATLSVRQPAPQQLEYLKIIFSNVLVTSFDEAAGADPPQDTIGFSFDHVEMTYTPQDPSGEAGDPVTAGWDLSKNVKI